MATKKGLTKPVDADTIRLCALVYNYFVRIKSVPMRAIDVDQQAEEDQRNAIFEQMRKVVGHTKVRDCK
ncbi:MAG: hypothetical protein ACREBR_04860 [bacterium]